MKLSDLQPGERGVIIKILGQGAFRKRVMEMGFVKGHTIEVLLNAPLQDPVKYKVMGYEVSLRRAEARLIEIMPVDSHTLSENEKEKPEDCINKEITPDGAQKVINVALLGNPNCGKTSLFNIASGSHEHVGNYAGVTVGAKEGSFHYRGYKINLVDLPGTYSLSAYSPEEEYVSRFLRRETPDVIVNVVVASNLERNLYLTTELIDMNLPMVIALNMFDELKRHHITLDYQTLGAMLGVPVVPTVASAGQGINELFDTVISVFEGQHSDVRHIHVRMRSEIEEGIKALNDEFKKNPDVSARMSPRYLAIKFLERDPEVERILAEYPDYERWRVLRDKEAASIERVTGDDTQSTISAEKYGFISGALAETMKAPDKFESKTTHIIDAFVTNKLFGFPIFLGVLWLMFWATFEIGAYPMEWIESGVSWLSATIGESMSPGPFKDLLLDGVVGGVGSVIVFLPNILILYAFISFMEDSGYMARVAFIMDKLMHRIGLHGKSFIPLIMGFGCNVPSITSTRTIESHSSRLITILIIPFMSCSARIPIYVLLVGCFFPSHGAWVFVGLYLLGILIAAATARLLRRFWFKADETPFVMELPPYRMPTAKATLRGMWTKADQYLRKMGGIILIGAVIIWALAYFPRYKTSDIPERYSTEAVAEMRAYDPAMLDTITSDELNVLILNRYQEEHSILGSIGKSIEPIVRPLDFDWKGAVALLAGLPAKEIVVSTMGVLYTGDGDNTDMLAQRLRTPSPISGKAPFTSASALAFMVFVLIYFPCLATLVAQIKEAGSWRYGLFSLIYNTLLAWILAFITYHAALLIF